MGIEGGSNNNEVQSQEIQQANIEQQSQNQEAHQRSGEQLEANSTIDNEGERKQIEGKDEATEDMNNEASELEDKDSIEDETPEQESPEVEAAQVEQSTLDNQDAIESESATDGADEEVKEENTDSLEGNNEITDSADDMLDDDLDEDNKSELDNMGAIEDSDDSDEIQEKNEDNNGLDSNETIEDSNDLENEDVDNNDDSNEIDENAENTDTDDKPEGEDVDNKPEGEDTDNKPEGEDADNKPDGEDTDNKPESEDVDNKPEDKDTDNKPEGEDTEDKPEGEDVDNKPEGEDTDNKPEDEDTDNKPESEDVDNKPEDEDTDNKPEGEDTEDKSEGEDADNKPEGEDTDNKPESEDVDNKPEDKDTDNKPEGEDTEDKPEGEDVENKPEGEDTDNKPESEDVDNKPEDEDTDNKPEGEDTEDKPEGEDVENKPEGEDTDNKPEDEDADNKPEGEDTEDKPEGEDADNKPESEDIDNKSESEDTDNKPESEDADNKPESEDTDNKPESEDIDNQPESEDTDNKPESEENDNKSKSEDTDNKPEAEEADNKLESEDADNKPESEDADNKPESEDTDNKPESEGAYNKPDSEDTDNKPESENTDNKPESEDTDNKSESDGTDSNTDNSGNNTDNAESNSDAKKPEKLEDLSWDQIDKMMQTPEGKAELMRLNADFRERYEADMWGMSQEDYQDYKAACERYKAEQEAKEKAGNPEHVEPSDAQKKADDVLARFDAMDGKSSRAYMSGAKAQDLKDISDSNSRYIAELKDARNEVANEKAATYDKIASMNYDGTKESNPGEYRKLCDQYYKLEGMEKDLDYAVVKMDMNNWDISQVTGMEYRDSGKKMEKSDIDKTFSDADSILRDGVSDDKSIMDAYRVGEKLEHDVLPSLDGERREIDSRINVFESAQESYLKEHHCTHEEAMAHPDGEYARTDSSIQQMKAESAAITEKMTDAVEKATALHDQVPVAGSDCKLKVIDNKNGTVTIERSWDNGGARERSHEGRFHNSEATTYRNATERKDSITLGQNSDSVYAHSFSFQYRGLGFKREDTFGGEGVKLKNSAEGGFLNFNASFGYKRGTEGKMSTLSADASGSLAQFKDTASVVAKDKEYAKFSADVSALKASASAKMDSSGVAKVSASSHIVGGEASASISGVTVAKVSGALGEAKTSASNDFLDMKASASVGDYKTSVSTWDAFKTPKEGGDSSSDKHLIVGNISGSLGNGTTLASEKFSSASGEWKGSNVVEQVKKDASTLVDGLKTGHLDINTDTVKGIVKDVEAIHGIKDKGFGVDVSKKPEEVVLGNSKLREGSSENVSLNEGEAKTAKNPESIDNFATSQGNNELGARGTCGETSVSNVINLITGRNDCSESTVLNYAVENGLCDLNPNPDLMGGTTTRDVVNLIDGMKNPEDNIHTEVYEYDKALSVDELANRLGESGTCAIVGVDSSVLWEKNTELSGSGYGANEIPSDRWITVESPQYDENGKLTGFNIVDSGGGETFVDRDKFEKMYLGDENRSIEDPTAIIVSNHGESINTYETSESGEVKQNYKGSALESDGGSPHEIEEAKQQLFEEARETKSQEAIDKLDSWKVELEKKGYDVSKVNEVMSKPMSERTEEEIKSLYQIRTNIENPSSETLMSKVVTEDVAKGYLQNSGSSNTVRGCVARACDCSGLKGSNDYIKTFGLNYVDDKTNTAPFLGVESIQVLRFTSEQSSDAYVPFGGNTSEDVNKFKHATKIDDSIHELKEWSKPFDGSGMTQEGTLEAGVTNNCAGSPELRVDKAIEIDEGAALFDIDAEKNETLLGVYDGETWILTAEGKKWLAERSNEDA